MQKYINTITCEDSLEVMRGLPDKCIDLILTDPPYNQAMNGGGNIAKKYDYRKKKLKEMSNFNPEEFLKIVKPKLKYFHAYIWTSKGLLNDYIKFAQKNNYNWDILVWVKNNPIPAYNNSYLSDLEFCMFIREKGKCYFNSKLGYNHYRKGMIDNVSKNTFGHPTQKYSWMIEKMLKTSSKKGDLVLDPFAGSHTTARACKDLGRNFISIEKEKKYCLIGEERLRQEVLF